MKLPNLLSIFNVKFQSPDVPTSVTPRVFISYSTIDKKYVTELVESLQAKGLDTWRDETELPLGQMLTKEIERGIENAHALIFIISPASVTSYWCNLELAHALKNKVHILPVMHQAIDDLARKVALQANTKPYLINDKPWQEVADSHWYQVLSGINWVPRDPNHTVEEAATLLNQTIRTDYAYLYEFARFRVLALHWLDHNQARGFTLPEGEIKLAESFLQRGKSQDKTPLDIQQKFIKASRHYRRRLRWLRRTLLMASIIALAVALVFLWQRQRTAFGTQVTKSSISLNGIGTTPSNWTVAAWEVCSALSLTRDAYNLDPTQPSFSLEDCPARVRMFVGEDRINEARLILGRACLLIDNFRCAEDTFQKIMQNPVFPPPPTFDSTKFDVRNNLTLALIGGKKFTEAQTIITQMEQSSDDTNYDVKRITRLQGKLAFTQADYPQTIILLTPLWEEIQADMTAFYREEVAFELAMAYHHQHECTLAATYWQHFWNATNGDVSIRRSNPGELTRKEEAELYQSNCP